MSNVSAINIPLTITFISPNATTNNGGNNITMQVAGSPSDPSQLVVYIDGK
jgi:hypothetical protein